MNRLLTAILLILSTPLYYNCNGQDKKTTAGKPIDESATAYYGIQKTVSATDTSPGWEQAGDHLLVTGTVYQPDSKTPAPGVLIYYYQTNTEGRYVNKPGAARNMTPNEQGQTHGYIRGWVKTDSLGRYFIYTVRPGAYPARDFPAHIHATIKEPGNIKEYYIDDFVFDDDRLLNSAYRQKMENRAGSGVLRLVKKNGLFIGERNLYLGLNIPGYTGTAVNNIASGREIGEDVFSFTPVHSWGPDKGTQTCPVCKYGWYHGILYFVGNNPNWTEIKNWLAFLEQESRKREKYLKVYFVYGNEQGYNKAVRNKELETLGESLQLSKLALTHVPSFSDRASDIYLNKINPQASTIILYKRSKITGKFINLPAGEESFKQVSALLDASVNEYFYLNGKEQP